MKKSSTKLAAIIIGLWMLLGVAAEAGSKPATTQPVTMSATSVMSSMSADVPVKTDSNMAATKPATMSSPPMAVMSATVDSNSQPSMKAKSGPDSKGSVIGGWLIDLLLYLLGIAITAITPVLTAWLWRKYKLDKYMEKKTVDDIVLKGVRFGIGKADEAAYKLRDNPMQSAEKLDLAIKKANDYIRDSGVAEKGSEYLADLIESELGKTRPPSNKAAKKGENSDSLSNEKAVTKEDSEDKSKSGDK